MGQEFSTLDIVKMLGIPRERLRVWMNKGYIRPSIHRAEKRGEKNLFSRSDLYIIGLFRYFLDKGLSWEVARHYIAVLQLDLAETKKQSSELDFFQTLNSIKTICFVTAYLPEKNQNGFKVLYQNVYEALGTKEKGSIAHMLDPDEFPKDFINQVDEVMTSKQFINELDEEISSENFIDLYSVNFSRIRKEVEDAIK